MRTVLTKDMVRQLHAAAREFEKYLSPVYYCVSGAWLADVWAAGGTETYLYVIQQGTDGPFKVGLANDPLIRVATLQQGNPLPLRLVTFVPCRRRVEASLHNHLAEHRLRGEWFRPRRRVLEFVAELAGLGALFAQYAIDAASDDGYVFGAEDVAEHLAVERASLVELLRRNVPGITDPVVALETLSTGRDYVQAAA